MTKIQTPESNSNFQHSETSSEQAAHKIVSEQGAATVGGIDTGTRQSLENAQKPLPEMTITARGDQAALSFHEQIRTRYLQDHLACYLPAVYQDRIKSAGTQAIKDAHIEAAREGKSLSVADDEKVQRAAEDQKRLELAERQRKVRQERGDDNKPPVFGSATQEAYKDVVDWIEHAAVPATLNNFAAAGRELPPGCPVSVPEENGRFIPSALYRAEVSNGEIKCDLGIKDLSGPPSQSDLASMGKALNWLVDAQDLIDQSRREYELKTMFPRLIRENGLPESWIAELSKPGIDPDVKRACAREEVDLGITARNYVAAMYMMGLQDKLDLPPLKPGTRPEVDEKGRLTRINLDLPQSLSLEDPANVSKVEALRAWIEKNGKAIDDASERYAQSADPRKRLFYGEIEVPGKVKLDASGKLEQIYPESADAPDLQAFNFLDSGFKVSNGKDADGKDTVVVHSTLQAREAHCWNYQNIGASNVGEAYSEDHEYKPEDLVAVRDGSGKVNMVQAKDLSDWLHWQEFVHYGSKTAVAAVDVGMLATGVGGIVGAGTELAGKELAFAVAKNAGRVLLGGSGFFLTNAQAHENATASLVNDVRGGIMLCDVGVSTLRDVYKGARWLAGGEAAATIGAGTKVLSAAEKIENGIAKYQAINIPYKVAHYGMELSNIPYAPILFSEISGKWNAIEQASQPDHMDAASAMIAEGRSLDMPARKHRDAAPEAVAAQQVLSNYECLLTQGKDESTKKQISGILKKTAELIASGSDEEKQAFRQSLIDEFRFDGPSLTKVREGGSYAEADSQPAAIDKNVKLAAAAGLLFLSPRAEGDANKAVLAQRSVKIDTYIKETDDGSETVSAHSEQQTLTREEVSSLLKKDMGEGQGTQRLMSGDLLVRAGERSPLSYACVLKDVVASKSAPKDDRLYALANLAGVINALRTVETNGAPGRSAQEAVRVKAHSYGLTSRDLEQSLVTLAGDASQDKDIRAMAASVVHNLDSQPDAEQFRAAFSAATREFVSARTKDGGYARVFVEQMQAQLNSENMTERFMAVTALRSLGDLGNMADDRVYNAALVRCIDPQQPQLTSLAVQQLQLHGAKEDLSDADRAKVADLLNARNNAEGMAMKVAVMDRLGLLVNGTTDIALYNSVGRSLERLIDRGDARDFAPSAETRAAAIKALGQLNVQSATSLILDELNADREPDAKVRLAALEALKSLAATGLNGKIVDDALKTETDHEVRCALIDVQSTRPRPLHVKRYEDLTDEYKAYLKSAQTNSTYNSQQWLTAYANGQQNKLFFDAEFKRETDEAVDAVTPGKYNFWSDSSIVPASQASARQTVWSNRSDQLNALGNMALGDQLVDDPNNPGKKINQGHEARMALLFMATDGVAPVGMEGMFAQNRFNAACMVRNLVNSDPEHRGEYIRGLAEGLGNVHVAPSSRFMFIEALDKIAEQGPEMKQVVAKAMSEALEQQMKEMPKEGEPYYDLIREVQMKLIEQLQKYNFAEVYAQLDACSDSNPMPEVKKRAAQALADMRDRVLPMRDQMPADTRTPVEYRARSLERALETGDANDVVNAINKFKGLPITANNDPRTKLLMRALADGTGSEVAPNQGTIGGAQRGDASRAKPAERAALTLLNSSEKVRLAAAIEILNPLNSAVSNEQKRKAVSALEELAAHGTQPGYRQDAEATLDLLPKAARDPSGRSKD